MTCRSRSTILSMYGLVALVAAGILFLPRLVNVPQISAADPPDEVVLNGIVHDFTSAHPDFKVAAAAGNGHYGGTVRVFLPGHRRPAFDANGFKVDTQWTDVDGRQIAPHLSGVRGGLMRETLGLHVNGAIEIKDEVTIDAFNSNYGPYGVLGNYGRDAIIQTNATADAAVEIKKKSFVRGSVYVGPGASPADVIVREGVLTGEMTNVEEAYPMPVVALPVDLDGYEDELVLTGAVTLTGDTTPDDDSDEPAMHVGTLRIQPNASVTIEGDLRIRCDRTFQMDKAQIHLAPEANLSIFVSDLAGNGDVEIKESGINVAEGDTTLVAINAIGSGKLKLDDESHVYATIMAPERKLEVKGGAHFYGGFIVGELKLSSRDSGIHADRGNAEAGKWNFALSVRDQIKLDGECEINSFDSNEGPYGGANRGQNAWVSTNATVKEEKIDVKNDSTIGGEVMIGPYGDIDKVVKVDNDSVITGGVGRLASPYPIPVVAPPIVPGSDDDVEFNGNSFTINSSFRCKKLKIENSAHIAIEGDVTIRCDDKLEMKKNSWIRLNPGASLTLYINKELKVEDGCDINMNTGNPQLVSIRMMSTGKKGKIHIKERSNVCAWILGSKSEMKLEDRSELYGSFAGRKFELKDRSKMHVDMAYLVNCVTVQDTSGTKGSSDSGGITSADSFDEWYRSVLGVNQSGSYPITLTRGDDGVLSYLDDEFFPVDDRLLGNEGESHNRYFTYSIGADFTYFECSGQFVEFDGGDGTWLFIDGQLVLDLGGVRAAQKQYIDLDRLGLEDGEQYRFRLFTAQRQAYESIFRLRTNLELRSDRTIPSVSAMFD